MSDFDSIDYSAYESTEDSDLASDAFATDDLQDVGGDSFSYELSSEVMESWPDGGGGDYSSDLSSEIIENYPEG